MSTKRKEMKRDYKEARKPMGVYQIRNTFNGKVLVGSSLNLPGMFNREKFALNMGSHESKSLQADWREHGPESFAFEVLDTLNPDDFAESAYRTELDALEKLWIENLQPYGDRGYNQKKLTREERLKLISRNKTAKTDASA